MLTSACSSEPDWIVIAAPRSGGQHQLGDNLFNRFSKGLGALDELELKSGNSACDAQTAERLARQVVNGEATTRLVIGPLCYSAFHSAQPIFEQAELRNCR